MSTSEIVDGRYSDPKDAKINYLETECKRLNREMDKTMDMLADRAAKLAAANRRIVDLTNCYNLLEAERMATAKEAQ